MAIGKVCCLLKLSEKVWTPPLDFLLVNRVAAQAFTQLLFDTSLGNR